MLLLELQDDDRTQTFLTQVKSAQLQGKTRLPVRGIVNYLITHLTFIHKGWITPLAGFLCILATDILMERLVGFGFGNQIHLPGCKSTNSKADRFHS